MKNRRCVFGSFVFGALLLCLASVSSGCAAKEKVDVQAQLQALKGSNAEAKQNACVELAKAGEAAAPAVKDLIAVLKDSDPLIRRLAAYALGEIGPKAKEAVPALRELFKDGDVSVVQNAIIAVRNIDPAAAAAIKTPPNVMTAPSP